MTDFTRMKYENPKLKQSQKANQLGYSTSILQRDRNFIIMVSPYTINPNNTNKRAKQTSITNSDNNSDHEPDVKRPQLTASDLKTNTKKKNKTILKAGSI